jgi:hypothetical protein
MKVANFTPAFKTALNKAAIEFGLENTTSARQKKNGTIEFYDSMTDCFYTLHENGYIRRRIRGGYFGYGHWRGYQLNKQHRQYTGRMCWYGREFNTDRVMMSEWEQLGKLITSIISYRNK